jgi:hypothetical protein
MSKALPNTLPSWVKSFLALLLPVRCWRHLLVFKQKQVMNAAFIVDAGMQPWMVPAQA